MKSNFHKKEYKKRQIVLSHSISLRGKNFPYSIDESGKVTEHYDPKYYSDFIDPSIDRVIIPIVLINEGWLHPDPISGRFTNWTGKEYSKPDENSLRQNWRTYRHWSTYSDEQIKSCITLCKELCDRFNIPKKSIGHNVILDHVERYKGITCRSNYSQTYTDLSPSFDFHYFQKELKK
ncbi:hypothetical protein COB55_03795 [Candidatus Wolfebacteria bacterium]|nr:MAG: hypothetical protein COB55_03795 [Candidatus Wolfebacteria bacterium]